MFTKEIFYWFCALSGTGMMIIQFFLNLIGLDADDHSDAGDQHFKWLTKQTLAGFLMFFGWTALTCQKEFVLSEIATMLCATIGGLIAVFATGLIFKLAKKLKSHGTDFRIEDAIGKEGIVYQRIPKDGVGKISVSLHDHTHEIDAISLTHEEICSFSPVQIIKKKDDKTLAVVPKDRS